MFNLKSTKNKLIVTTILEILFTAILILLLVFVRQKSIDYLYQVQDLSSEIKNLEQDLTTQNLTTYDSRKAQQTISTVDTILTKGLFLLKVVLPFLLMILSLLFYFFIWRTLTDIPIKRFLLSSVVPLLLLLSFVYYTLNYIAYKFYFVPDSPLIVWIISIILLVITYYLSLFFLSNKKSFKQNANLSVRSIKKLILPFMLILIMNLVYLVLIFVVFFLTYIDSSIVLLSLVLLILIIVMNIQRISLVNKIFKLN